MNTAQLIKLIPETLLQALSKHQDKYTIYLVGGAVRDYYLGNTCINDWDFVVFGESLDILLESVSQELNTNNIKLDIENGHYRFASSSVNWQADFAMPRGNNIQEDLNSRDFTINALAVNIFTGELHDYNNCQQDISTKTIRQINSQVLEEDLLRCVRAFRFASKLQGYIDLETLSKIQDLAGKYNIPDKVAGERIIYELWRVFEAQYSYAYIKQMFDIRLMQNIIPELKEFDKVPSNQHHHLPLTEHTLELINQYENKIRYWLSPDDRQLVESTAHLFKMACILHDICKPETWEITEEGRHTFHNHDDLGADKTVEILKRLKCSNKEISYISTLVKYHLRPFQLSQKGQLPSSKAMTKLIKSTYKQDWGYLYIELIALAWSDMYSVRGEQITLDRLQTSHKSLEYTIEFYKSYIAQVLKTPPLLTGDVLVQAIKEAKLPPTKIIKELLEKLYEHQLAGEIKTVEEATNWFISHGQKLKSKTA